MSAIDCDWHRPHVDAPFKFVCTLDSEILELDDRSGLVVNRMGHRGERFRSCRTVALERAIARCQLDLADMREYVAKFPYDKVRKGTKHFGGLSDHAIYRYHVEHLGCNLPLLMERGKGKIGYYDKVGADRWLHVAVYMLLGDPEQPDLFANDPADVDFLVGLRRTYGELAQDFFDAAVKRAGDVYQASRDVPGTEAESLLLDVVRYEHRKKTLLPVHVRINNALW